MIRLKPFPDLTLSCDCGGLQSFSEYIWQGVHICEKYVCGSCYKTVIKSIPVNQSAMSTYTYLPEEGIVKDKDGNLVPDNWFSEKLKSIGSPKDDKVDMEIEVIRKCDNVLILNTLDFVYGHSLLFLLNLQKIIERKNDLGIVLIIQPMFKWMVQKNGVSEIWTVNLGFRDLNNYFPDLSVKINRQLEHFNTAYLSQGHLIPTNKNIQIESFTGITPFDFLRMPSGSRITFIWREDPDRLWIRNIWLLKGFKKLGLGKLLLPLSFLRASRFFSIIRKRLGKEFRYTVAGLGRFGSFPSFVDDQRIISFNTELERQLCKIYAESIITIGVHGSSMLLPSAHAGMTLSLMPSKRWGNFLEDILFTEEDIRLASFQRRVIPLNLALSDLRDIVVDMISGRDYFIKKFIHSDEL